MSRSIELGRAVLCSPAANLELWLTTLITISPQQDDTNLQDFKPAQLLELLASGNVWVRRGHGMHIDLLPTLREEPLPHRQLQDLIEGILRAPIWDQLMLQTSLPSDVVLEPGLIRLNITYAADGGPPEEQRRHRVFENVPAADVGSPDGVSTIDLQSVLFRMDILETRQRPRAPIKKPKALARKSEHFQPEARTQDRGEPAVSNTNFLDDTPFAKASYTSHDPALVGLPVERKRKRSVTNPSMRTSSSPNCGSDYSKDMRRRPTNMSDVQSSTHPTLPASDRGEIEGVIDGALRLSVCGSFNNRSKLGLKIKASTFALGLADIAPALWRPGYLSALSQRARMLPTISRSLFQAASVRVVSLSLKNKMSSLTIVPRGSQGDISNHEGLVAEPDVGRLTSYVASRLWLHLQKNVTSKSATTLQAFVTSSSTIATRSDSDDMLEDVRQFPKNWQCKSTPEDEDAELLDDKPVLRRFWSTTEMEKVLLRENDIQHSGTKHGSEEFGDSSLLDPDPSEFEPTVTSLGKRGSISSHPNIKETLPSLDNCSNKLDKQELQYTIGSDWTVAVPLSTPNLQSLPVLAAAGPAQDDLLFDECGEPVENPTLALGSKSE